MTDYSSAHINAIKLLERARESAERHNLLMAITLAMQAKLEVEFVIEAFEAMQQSAAVSRR